MAVEMCNRCDRWVDLDYCVEGIIYLPTNEAVCPDCLTEEEAEWAEKEGLM